MGWFVSVVLSLLLSHFPSCPSSLVTLCNNDEASALLGFKTSFSLGSRCGDDGGYPKTESWKNGTDCCLWDGVSCDTNSGHVIGLDLSRSCFHGPFYSNNTLFKLTHLQKLNLALNNFSSSPMPSGFGHLLALTHLNLSNAAFSGVIPSKISHLSKLVSLDLSLSLSESRMRVEPAFLEKLIVNATHLRELTLDGLDMSLIKPSSLSLLVNFSSSLVSLGLSNTILQGKLPNDIFYLPNLQQLNLSLNYLEGELPQLNRSTTLRHLDLGDNAFSGHIQFLSNLTQLKHLDLGANKFSGEILLSLSKLQRLTYIDIRYNNFTGPIPHCMGNISQLNYLSLRTNKFSGEIPSSLFDLQHLINLDLAGNNFDGEIPNLFGKLSKLELLDLTGNNLVGQLPSSSFELTQISYLILSGNKLVGQIPDTTGGLSKLAYLDLSDNLLNGTIPSWCFSLSSLVYLILGGNQLTGPIGEFSGFSLSYCDLSNNKLQGGIPKSIFFHQNLSQLMLSSNNLSGLVDLRNFSNLQVLRSPASRNYLILDLSKNQIHGRIPEGFNHMADTLDYLDLSHNLLTSVGNLSLSSKNMYYIDLSFNMLEGDIPVPPSTVQFFSISNNKLTGDISSSLCNASSLVTLILSHNNLTGKLPKCVGNLSNLIVLDLQRNNLRGIIPRSYLEIETLETFNFNGNQLEGPLPRHVIKCKQLRVLDLGHNNIQDTFPSWLESLQELRVLVLRANRFNGTINCFQSKNDTFSKLTVFDISNNNFRGNLPVALFKNFKGMMINVHSVLQYIRPTYYGYNDSIEVTIKGNTLEIERILTTLTIVDLSNNRFEGTIPTIIGELKSLIGLNLSNNRITGFIPENLNGLENLEWLDLSSNILTGVIPTSLANLPFLSFLNLSQNQLVGKIPTGKQFNTFQNESYRDNLRLCGWPLTKTCYKGEKDLETFHNDDQFCFGWKVVAIGYGCGGVFGMVLGYLILFIQKPEWSIRLVEGILNQRMRKKNCNSNPNRRPHDKTR